MAAGDYRNSKVLVLGLARSGVSAFRLLRSKGAELTGADEEREMSLPEDIRSGDIRLGPFENSLLDGCDEVILSPGISAAHPLIREAAARSIPVISELELGYRFAEGEIIAVTGTNGKSTTVSMIESILNRSGRTAVAAGNIGKPVCSVLSSAGSETVLVLEVSSFQLDTIDSFRPSIAGILNMTPDHLDRYDSEEDYYRAKESIIDNCREEDSFFYNAGDRRCQAVAERFPGRTIPFSARVTLSGGVTLRGDDIVIMENGEVREQVMNRSELGVVGFHNVENSMAAIAAAAEFGTDTGPCRRALSDFKGLRHRMELIRTLDGVDYYNDSKATNVEAAVMSLRGMPVPVTLIAGGLDKGSDYSKLLEVSDRIRNVILIGKAAGLIEEALGGSLPVRRAPDMAGAVRISRELSVPGTAVILSPACASFDMYRDFRERGERFAEEVNRLEGGDDEQ